MLNLIKGLAAFALFGAMFLIFVGGVGLVVWFVGTGQYVWAALVGVVLALWGYIATRVRPGEHRNDFGV